MAARSKKAKSRRKPAKAPPRAKKRKPAKRAPPPKPTRKRAAKLVPKRRPAAKRPAPRKPVARPKVPKRPKRKLPNLPPWPKAPKPAPRKPKPPARKPKHRGPSKKERRERAIKGWLTRRHREELREESMRGASPLLIDTMIRFGATAETTPSGLVLTLQTPAGAEPVTRWIEVEEALREALREQSKRGPLWVQAGVTFDSTDDYDETGYDELEGQPVSWQHPSRVDRFPEHFLGAQNMTENMQEFGHRILQLFLRVTIGEKPVRDIKP